jgi:hypothetical protein
LRRSRLERPLHFILNRAVRLVWKSRLPHCSTFRLSREPHGRIGRSLLLAVLFAFSFADTGTAATDSDATLRGGRVGWARLATASRHWDVHGGQDGTLAAFIKGQTSLNIDSTSYSAEPGKLEELCKYPFLYSKDLSPVRDARHQDNLREFLQRGGFLCVDFCGSPSINRDVMAVFRRNREFFQKLLPGAEVRQLPRDHPVYRCYFTVGEEEIFTKDMGKQEPGEFNGLYGVFSGGRMVAMISMYGLECGWPQTPLRTPGCMKMILNIYVYAMTLADA